MASGRIARQANVESTARFAGIGFPLKVHRGRMVRPHKAGATIMHNVTHTVEGDTLVIRVKVGPDAINAAPPSTTGKTHLVASTGAAVPIDVPGCKRAVSFSANVMVKAT
jgi:hypothetical protein